MEPQQPNQENQQVSNDPNAAGFFGQQPNDQNQPQFQLGVSANANKPTKVKTAAEVAEQRRLEMMSGK